MKLNDTQPVTGYLWVFRSDKGVSKSLGKPRLARTGRPLQHQVLLTLDARNELRESLGGKEASFIGNVRSRPKPLHLKEISHIAGPRHVR